MSKQKEHLKKLNIDKQQKAAAKHLKIAQAVHKIKLKKPNFSLLEISDILSISYNLVYSSYKKHYPENVGVKNNGSRVYGRNKIGHNARQSISDDQHCIIRELYYTNKLTLKQIGKKYSCTAGAVLNFFKKHNIERRSNSEASFLIWTDEKRRVASENGVKNYLKSKKTDTLPELRFKEWLMLNNLNYHAQYRKTGIPHPYDFFIPKLNLLVEIDGTFWHSVSLQKEKDTKQVEHAIKKGYNIVRVDVTEVSKKNYDFNDWIFKENKWHKAYQI